MFSLYKKELQFYFYSPFAYVLTALFLFIFSLSFVTSLADLDSSTLKFSFPNIFYNNFFYFIFLIPLLTMRTFADERRGNTEVLLLSSPLSIPSIVLAKFLAIATVLLVMMVVSLFFPIVTLFLGEVIWSSLICAYIGFFLWGLTCITIGMLLSALVDNAIVAAIIGEIIMEGLLLLDSIAESALVDSYPALYNSITWFSMQRRFTYFSQGLFRLEDLVFFVSFTVMFLAWISILIDKRRLSRK